MGYIASPTPAWAVQQALPSKINKDKTVLFYLNEVSKIAEFIETENRTATAAELGKASRKELPGA